MVRFRYRVGVVWRYVKLKMALKIREHPGEDMGLPEFSQINHINAMRDAMIYSRDYCNTMAVYIRMWKVEIKPLAPRRARDRQEQR